MTKGNTLLRHASVVNLLQRRVVYVAWRLLYCKVVDCLLEAVEEAGGFEAVHLGVVELEGDGQRGLEEPPPVFAPSQEGVGEHLGVDAHHRVDFAFWQRRGVDGHVLFGQEVVLVGVVDLACQPEVVFVELADVLREGYVAEMGFALGGHHDGVYRQAVVLPQVSTGKQGVELGDRACRMADAPTHQHVGLQPSSPAQRDKPADMEGLGDGHFRHRGIFP